MAGTIPARTSRVVGLTDDSRGGARNEPASSSRMTRRSSARRTMRGRARVTMRRAWPHPHPHRARARAPAVPARRADRFAVWIEIWLRAGAARRRSRARGSRRRWRPLRWPSGSASRCAGALPVAAIALGRRWRRRRLAGRPRHHRPRHRPVLRACSSSPSPPACGSRAGGWRLAFAIGAVLAACRRRSTTSARRTRTARSSSRRCSRSAAPMLFGQLLRNRTRLNLALREQGARATSASAPTRPRRPRSRSARGSRASCTTSSRTPSRR